MKSLKDFYVNIVLIFQRTQLNVTTLIVRQFIAKIVKMLWKKTKFSINIIIFRCLKCNY